MSKMGKQQIKFPATVTVHWATGPVAMCKSHAAFMVKVGEFIGYHVAVTPLFEEEECSNCVNDKKTNPK